MEAGWLAPENRGQFGGCGMSMRLTLRKNPGQQGLVELPCLLTLCMYFQISFWGEEVHSHKTPLTGNTWKLMPIFSWTLPMCIFPLADFGLCPSVVINCNCKYKSFFWVLSVYLSSISLKLNVILETLIQLSYFTKMVKKKERK